MKRREFISLDGGGMAAWPSLARTQEPGRTYRLGMVVPSGRDAPPLVAFFDERRRNGFIEGRNLSVVAARFNVREHEIADAAAERSSKSAAPARSYRRSKVPRPRVLKR